jgi:hypothetical protein
MNSPSHIDDSCGYYTHPSAETASPVPNFDLVDGQQGKPRSLTCANRSSQELA